MSGNLATIHIFSNNDYVNNECVNECMNSMLWGKSFVRFLQHHFLPLRSQTFPVNDDIKGPTKPDKLSVALKSDDVWASRPCSDNPVEEWMNE